MGAAAHDSMQSAEDALEEREACHARIGTVVGRYRIDSLIGLGGMAAVYSATVVDAVDGEEPVCAALKIARRRIANEPITRERFAAEADIAGCISHPAGVPIYDCGITPDGAPYLAMELLHGESLATRWRRTGAFSIRKALLIGDQLLDFIGACHAAGVLHRDLKPDNIFLTVDGDVRVIDFGIAAARGRRDASRGRIVGTPAYMPPEQARGSLDHLDERADIYAIGAILWTLLSGHRLRTGRGALELAARDPARSLALVSPDAPHEVANLIDRALATDPADRWASADEMRDELLHVLDTLDDDSPAFADTTPSERCMRALRASATIPVRSWRPR